MVVLRGGARIGRINVTWPFARLKINGGILNINASTFANLYFVQEDIVSVEPYTGLFNKGIRIIHNVKEYKDEIIFWTFSDPKTIASIIKSNLEIEKGEADTLFVKARQEEGPKVFKRSSVISIIIIFFILLLVKYYSFYKLVFENEVTSNTLLKVIYNFVFVFLIAVSLSLILSEKFRKFLYRKNITEDIDSNFLLFITFLSTVLFIASFKAGV